MRSIVLGSSRLAVLRTRGLQTVVDVHTLPPPPSPTCHPTPSQPLQPPQQPAAACSPGVSPSLASLQGLPLEWTWQPLVPEASRHGGCRNEPGGGSQPPRQPASAVAPSPPSAPTTQAPAAPAPAAATAVAQATPAPPASRGVHADTEHLTLSTAPAAAVSFTDEGPVQAHTDVVCVTFSCLAVPETTLELDMAAHRATVVHVSGCVRDVSTRSDSCKARHGGTACGVGVLEW